MIVRTEAIVLRAMDYGETSQIVSLYTRRHGRLSVLARGARRPKSRFGATLQPMSLVQAVYYYKAERELQTLTEASHLQRFPRLLTEMDRLTLGFRLVELARGLTEPLDPSATLFDLLAEALARLDATDERARNVLPHTELRMAAHLGFAPDVQREDVLALPEEGGVLALDSGAVLPGGRGLRASRAALRAFAIFARTDLDTALRLTLDDETFDETTRLTAAFLRHHAEGYLPERTAGVARQLLAPALRLDSGRPAD